MAWLVLGATMALSSPACRSFNSFCTEQVDCEDGNDQDIEACEESAQRAEERASIIGCSAEFGELADCAEAESSCENDVYTFEDNCELEVTNFSFCMNDKFN